MARHLTPQQCQRVEDIFGGLLSMTPADRNLFLDRECSDDPLVRLELVELLQSTDGASKAEASRWNSLRRELAEVATEAEVLPAGTIVDEFRIVRLIARGGMGDVYQAQQTTLYREVAIKLVRPGRLTPTLIRRFQFEAEILGRLDHPGIARIHRAGVADTPLGVRQFFAMEFIEGRPLDQYAQARNLALDERVRLFLAICEAVHHAHTRGVIHRDLKPANILVAADGQPKILDFGVARATDADLLATTMHTESGQLVGTLPYMAPEQAAGKVADLDASSDVYALGVIAYELFAGRRPYELRELPIHKAVEIICTAIPPHLGRLDRRLRGDLEMIVAKALAKKKQQRYGSAGELAEDLRRHSRAEPVSARKPSAAVSLGKSLIRHRVAASVTLAFLLVLLLGLAGTTTYYLRASQERRAAQQRADEYQAVTQFFENYHLGDRWRSDLDRRDNYAVIQDTIKRLDTGVLGNQPLSEASLRFMMGNALRQQHRSPEARAQLAKSLRIREALLAGNDIDLVLSRLSMGILDCEENRFGEAETLLRETMPVMRSHPKAVVEDVLGNMWYLARAVSQKGPEGRAEALALFKDSIALSRRAHPDNDAYVAYLWHEIAKVYLMDNRLNQVTEACQNALDLLDRHPLPDPQDMRDGLWPGEKKCAIIWTRVLGWEQSKADIWLKKDCETALALLNAAELDTASRRRQIVQFAEKLGDAQVSEGALAEAEKNYRKALAAQRTLTDTKTGNDGLLYKVYSLCAARGNLAEAERLCRETWDNERSHYAIGYSALGTLYNYLCILKAENNEAKAAPFYRDLYQLTTTTRDPLPAEWAARFVSWHGPALARAGLYKEANAPLREAYRRLKDTDQPYYPGMRDVLEALVQTSAALGSEDAPQWRREWEAWDQAMAGAVTKPARLLPLAPLSLAPLLPEASTHAH